MRWSALDVVTMNVVYENGKEDYRDITVNGKPKKSLEETGGAWSTGRVRDGPDRPLLARHRGRFQISARHADQRHQHQSCTISR